MEYFEIDPFKEYRTKLPVVRETLTIEVDKSTVESASRTKDYLMEKIFGKSASCDPQPPPLNPPPGDAPTHPPIDLFNLSIAALGSAGAAIYSALQRSQASFPSDIYAHPRTIVPDEPVPDILPDTVSNVVIKAFPEEEILDMEDTNNYYYSLLEEPVIWTPAYCRRNVFSALYSRCMRYTGPTPTTNLEEDMIAVSIRNQMLNLICSQDILIDVPAYMEQRRRAGHRDEPILQAIMEYMTLGVDNDQ